MAKRKVDPAKKSADNAKQRAPAGKAGNARISKFLSKAMKQFEERLQNEEIKPTVGDYLKLMQIEKDLDGDETREIKVTWVDQEEESEG